MPSNSLLHFITQVINLKSVKVTNYYFITENEILIEVKNINPKAPCPHCGKLSDQVHQNHSRRVRDIPLSSYQVWLNVNRRQLKCPSCKKVFSEDLDFVKKRRSYTTRLAAKVVKEVLETNLESTARRNGLTSAEIETLLKEAEAETCPEKPEDLKKLGIDEITQLKGGKNYAAVLVNLETRKPITLLKKRNKETRSEYLRGLGSAFLEKIEEVSIDLWRPYKSLIEEMLPNAQIVADRFHVMKQINEELDRRKKKEKRETEKQRKSKKREKKLAGSTYAKYPLLKQQESLNDEERAKIEEIKKVAPELEKMYDLKEGIREIFSRPTNRDETLDKFWEWTENAHQYFPKSCRTISRPTRSRTKSWLGRACSCSHQKYERNVCLPFN